GEGMLLLLYAEDQVVAGQANLNHHITPDELLQQAVRVIFVHDVNAMANALGVAFGYRVADMKSQPFGWDHSGSEFTRVQRNVGEWILRSQKVKHLHMQ